MIYKKIPAKRYEKTLRFLKQYISENSHVLDLGTPNEFSEIMRKNKYQVINTKGEDLDLEFEVVKNEHIDVVTAFEIFEHMVCPFNVLRAIKAKKLIASVPLKLWFSNAYWGKNSWDKHYHEFEKRQFHMLLEKSGWQIISSEQWTSPTKKIGIRPLLRYITPRYYIVYCIRN